jgi:hypothetical protein
MRVAGTQPDLLFENTSDGVQFASIEVPVPAQATFVRVHACLGSAVRRDSLVVALASVADQHLDFNRAYRLWIDGGGRAGDCFDELMPRRQGDGAAVLQVQLRQGPESVRFARLMTAALIENPLWHWMRMLMLTLGIGLVAQRFAPFIGKAPRRVSSAGLLVVAGIVFGCCVSVALKADIFALATGGRSVPASESLPDLLRTEFPLGGFSMFTLMHAVLFAAAMFLLGYVDARAWLPLMLLGATTEVLQIFVPGRGPGFSDMFVDWSGVALGVALLLAFRRGQGKGLLFKEQGID